MALTNGPNLALLVNGLPGEEHYDELMAQWRGFDVLVQCSVIDRDLAVPPGSPANGDAYIVASGPAGAWVGHTGKIARWSSAIAAWEFFTPKAGWRAHAVDEALNLTYTGAAWVAMVMQSDTDVTLAANSDARVPTQKAAKAYIDSLITGGASDVMRFMGVIDASTNPNYPAANGGHLYKISVAGKIGGASGPNVEAGDTIYALTDGVAAGTHAAVGANWAIAQANVDGAVAGPVAAVVNNNLAVWDGTSGRLLKDGGPPATRVGFGETVSPLTDAGTITVNAALANNFRVTLAGNRTLANPTGMISGQVINFRIKQDATGSRTLAYGTKYLFPGGTDPVLSTAANALDFMSCQYDATDDTWVCVMSKAFS